MSNDVAARRKKKGKKERQTDRQTDRWRGGRNMLTLGQTHRQGGANQQLSSCHQDVMYHRDTRTIHPHFHPHCIRTIRK